jgi:membrane-associated protease RseP (regulator of RpoE activity)
VSYSAPDSVADIEPLPTAWRDIPNARFYTVEPLRPASLRSLIISCALFVVTFCTCLVAGTQFATAYAHNQAVSWEDFVRAFGLVYKNPLGLAAGLPFALTLMMILLAHELGHFFACRYHRIQSSYPFFLPFPTLIGTLGAFILIRSPIRTTRALFDVGASGPLVGFVAAVPALIYGVLHAKFVPGLSGPHAEFVLGTPLIVHFLSTLLHPGAAVTNLLLHPIGRAAWVGLFATSLNLLPAAQLDGGHILRAFSPRAHRYSSLLLPLGLISLGYFHYWMGWYIWGGLLLGIRFFRSLPIYHPEPLDVDRRAAALLTLLIFVLCFMPAPFLER